MFMSEASPMTLTRPDAGVLRASLACLLIIARPRALSLALGG
jgi:hypothetical protein